MSLKWPKVRKQDEEDIIDYPDYTPCPRRFDEKNPNKSGSPAGVYIVGKKTWQITNKKSGKCGK